MALLTDDELSSLMETIHLLRSPKNAQRLLAALARALNNDPAVKPQTVEELRQQIGLDRDEQEAE